jgi:Rrf2 family protein
MHLAHFESDKPVQRQDIARQHGIPADYLDQILLKLRKGGLISSIRGRGGGYKLSRNPADLTIWDMVSAVESHIHSVQCQTEDDGCKYELACISKGAWGLVDNAIKESLSKLNLAALTEVSQMADSQMCPIGGIRECRQG